MNTVYILQKDLPYAKAGASYHLRDDNYVCNDMKYLSEDIAHDTLKKRVVENNPEWFKSILTGLIGVNITGNVVSYGNSASIKIGEDGVVSAIGMDGKIFIPESENKYTEADMRKCFNEAKRQISYCAGIEGYRTAFEFNTYEEYLQYKQEKITQ